MQRAAGVILPIASLPSRHGVGTLGAAARDFVLFLEKSGLGLWQVLPAGPTGFGDSPYQSFSAFAGNEYFIDLDELVDDGLLTASEVETADLGDVPGNIDYEKLFRGRFALLRKAAGRGALRDRAEIERFERENAYWLHDYALFRAIKRHFGEIAWTDWPDEAARRHEAAALERYARELEDDIRAYVYAQLLFFRQWEALKSFAHEHGVALFGDMPIYAAADSADVWAKSDYFALDDGRRAVGVAGVPPDYFSENGQLWGNPLYDWAELKRAGYDWWIARVEMASRLFDVLRIDHFRGFESYWEIPAGECSARNGRWVKGPGAEFIRILREKCPQLQLVAEDLGLLTDDVRRMLSDCGLPGMKVLEFAFDGSRCSTYLPHNYEKNCVCYTGTHDNAPLLEWMEENPENARFAREYFGLEEGQRLDYAMLRGGMASTADVFIAQMQDYLSLGADSRTNTPGTLGTNWRWRLLPEQADDETAQRIRALVELYGRKAGAY